MTTLLTAAYMLIVAGNTGFVCGTAETCTKLITEELKCEMVIPVANEAVICLGGNTERNEA